jgi:hypothetical protein
MADHPADPPKTRDLAILRARFDGLVADLALIAPLIDAQKGGRDGTSPGTL